MASQESAVNGRGGSASSGRSAPKRYPNNRDHSFDVEVACDFGVDEAILIKTFQHFISTNRDNGQHHHEGKWWTYQTLDALKARYPYWKLHQIRRIIASLEKKGVLMTAHLGHLEKKAAFDRTLWYAFVDEEMFLGDAVPLNDKRRQHQDEQPREPICENPQMHVASAANAFAENHKSHVRKSANESKEAVTTPVPTHVVTQLASSHARAHEESFTGRKSGACSSPPAAMEIDPDLAEGIHLLMTPVAEGGAGFVQLESAAVIASARGVEELRHWIALAKRRKMENFAGFIYKRITAGDGPPESYLRAEKQAYTRAGQGVADRVGGLARGMAMPDVRIASGRPDWEQSEDDGEDRPAPVRREAVPMYHQKLGRNGWMG